MRIFYTFSPKAVFIYNKAVLREASRRPPPTKAASFFHSSFNVFAFQQQQIRGRRPPEQTVAAQSQSHRGLIFLERVKLPE